MKVKCINSVGTSLLQEGRIYTVEDKITHNEDVYYMLNNGRMYISGRFNIVDSKTEKENNMSNVEHPKHYNQGKYEVIDVIEDWDLGFNLGNAIKYIARAEYKGNYKEDLEKAIFYIKYELSLME